MDAAQRAAFEADGYIVVRGAVGPAQLAALNAAYDARVQRPAVLEGAGAAAGVENAGVGSPEVGCSPLSADATWSGGASVPSVGRVHVD